MGECQRMCTSRPFRNVEMLCDWMVENPLSNPFPIAKEMEEWANVVWRLKDSLMVAFLRKDLLFLEFVDPEDAKWVIEARNISFGGNPL